MNNPTRSTPIAQTETGDLLRRAAEWLRSPYLCNWDTDVASAVAALLDQHAKGVDARVFAEQHVGLAPGTIIQNDEVAAVALARALMKSSGRDEQGGA